MRLLRWFQSTLPHGERRAFYVRVASSLHVSIHAPARGATRRAITSCVIQLVSIHAPARGATRLPEIACNASHCFNPRSRTGSDRSSPIGALLDTPVSIHAPARGATLRLGRQSDYVRRFNPRSRTGSDSLQTVVVALLVVSIHAPARGATYSTGCTKCGTGFQSTLPHGERQDRVAQVVRATAFQSTLPHGERHPVLKEVHLVHKFQSTLPHGERLWPGFVAWFHGVSIHAPARGATHVNLHVKILLCLFQSTLPHGERHRCLALPPRKTRFNPRSRTGSDLLLARYQIPGTR